MYESAQDLLIWQRIVRREAMELLERQSLGRPGARLLQTPIPGAELLCPACSSEARPDDDDTATCGTCGTLSPIDVTVSFSNFVHKSLHFGLRTRLAMARGDGGAGIPAVSEPFPLIAVRVASLLDLAAVAGMRRQQLDELLGTHRPLLQRWVQKELEEGDRGLMARVPPKAAGTDIAQSVLDAALGPLPEGFPNADSLAFTLEQVFFSFSQYYKYHTTSHYVAQLSDALCTGLRERLGLSPWDPLPWKETAPLAKALDANARGDQVRERYRGSEESLGRAVASFQQEKIRLVRTVHSRHRVMAQLPAT